MLQRDSDLRSGFAFAPLCTPFGRTLAPLRFRLRSLVCFLWKPTGTGSNSFVLRLYSTMKAPPYCYRGIRTSAQALPSLPCALPAGAPLLRVRILSLYQSEELSLVTAPHFGGERGIRTLDTAVAVYTISSRAPSTSSAISP